MTHHKYLISPFGNRTYKQQTDTSQSGKVLYINKLCIRHRRAVAAASPAHLSCVKYQIRRSYRIKPVCSLGQAMPCSGLFQIPCLVSFNTN